MRDRGCKTEYETESQSEQPGAGRVSDPVNVSGAEGARR